MGVRSRPAFSASIAKKPPQSTIAASELPKSETAPHPWRTLLCFESKDEKCKLWAPLSPAYKLTGGFENEDE
jgi:hypothetical protein